MLFLLLGDAFNFEMDSPCLRAATLKTTITIQSMPRAPTDGHKNVCLKKSRTFGTKRPA